MTSAQRDFDLKVGDTAWLHDSQDKTFFGRHPIDAISDDGNTITLNDVNYTYNLAADTWISAATGRAYWITFLSLEDAKQENYFQRENAEAGLELPPGLGEPTKIFSSQVNKKVTGEAKVDRETPPRSARDLFGMEMGEVTIVQDENDDFVEEATITDISEDGNDIRLSSGSAYGYDPADGYWVDDAGGLFILTFGMSYEEAVAEGVL